MFVSTSHQSDLSQTHPQPSLRRLQPSQYPRNVVFIRSGSTSLCAFLPFLSSRSLLTLAWAHIHHRSLALGSPETLTYGKSSHSNEPIELKNHNSHQTRSCARWRPRCLASRCRTGSQPRGVTPRASKTKSSARRTNLQTPPVSSRDPIFDTLESQFSGLSTSLLTDQS